MSDSLTGEVPPSLSELESKVMEAMWSREEATVRHVMEALNAKAERRLAYTTYMTIMNRLDGKGLLERRREGKTDIYRSRWSHEDFLEARARAEVAALVDEFGDVALVHFTRQTEALDPDRRKQLRRLARRDA